MNVKEQGNGVEEIIYDMINVFENLQREIRTEMEKLKDEMRCREKDWTEERNKLKERIEILEVRCKEYKIKNIEMRQLEGTEMVDSEKEDVECVWDRRGEMIKEWLDKFMKDVQLDEGKKNNTRDALISTTPSQLQSTQLASISTDFVRDNNYIDLIETPSTSGRCAQNQNSNLFQLNESNRTNTANGNTISEERKNHTSSINFGNFNYSANKSNQSASSNSHNANIMCNCKKPAVQRAQKVGPNKERVFCYKCSENVCNFYKWTNEDSAKSQGNAGKKRSMVSCPSKNSDSNFSRPSTSKDNWNNPSTNVMCNCNQPAKKMAVFRDGPKKGRLFYRCPKGPNSTCKFFKWADKDDSGIPQNANAFKKPKLIRGTRKCGICGIEGHIRYKCPNVVSSENYELYVMNNALTSYINELFPK